MKYMFYSAVIAAGLALAAPPASAMDLFGNGLGSAVNGQVGVSSHINNTPVYAPIGADVSARNRNTYERHSAERTINDRTAIQTSQEINSYPADIAPAAGVRAEVRTRNIPPSARVMGGIQGGTSYND